MADFNGTPGNDTWTVIDPGDFSLDGLGGVDTLDLGTSLRSSYRITRNDAGTVFVDSISGASGALHATLFNLELLVFNSGRDTLDLRTLFGDLTPPLLAISDNTAGTARGNVTYTLNFSEAVTALSINDLVVGNASIASFSGSGASYQVVLTPTANAVGTMTLTVKAAAVTDVSGNPLAQTSAAAQPFDTNAPALLSFSPASATSGVAVGVNLVFNFTEAVQRGSGTIFVFDNFGQQLFDLDRGVGVTATASGSQLVINPTQDLPQGAHITVGFNSGLVTDLAGNALPPPFGYTFNTADDALNPHRYGTASNDLFNLIPGNQVLVGGPGIDTVAMGTARGASSLTHTLAGYALNNNATHASVLLDHVERVQFSDGKLALDLDGRAGTVVKIIGAVFGPALVHDPAFVGIGLQIIDGGMSYPDLMQLALNFHLGAGASNTLIVQTLYTNVVGFAPSPENLAAFVGLLENHSFTPATLGMLAADHDLNLARIDLVGLMQTGIEFS